MGRLTDQREIWSKKMCVLLLLENVVISDTKQSSSRWFDIQFHRKLRSVPSGNQTWQCKINLSFLPVTKTPPNKKHRIGVALLFLVGHNRILNCGKLRINRRTGWWNNGFNPVWIEIDCHLEVFLLGSHLTSFIF